MVVTDTPSPAVVAQTSSVPVVAGTVTTGQRPESTESEQSDDAVSVSSGEYFQVTREVQWPQTSRHMMQEKGLYRKHSLDHPLLKGFATYLEKDLLNENFKQEVENASRFMFYMNPLKPSLEFVREREKARLFFRELSEAGLSGQTQVNYLKSLRRFLKYHTVITDLRHDSRGLWNDAKFFMEELSSLQLSCAKLASKEIVQRRHAILTEKNPLNAEDCWAVLRAAKHDFLAIVGKVYPEETPLELKECCLLLNYLEAIVILKHLQQAGVVEHMTVSPGVDEEDQR
ncbi:uncharacterized protein [Paramormyrops kingsleyae]|uniref:uncharacterized protein n=1 Tax=Paramormyrops kingsleyae TaxID=1676925 RepID=UPI003B97AA94